MVLDVELTFGLVSLSRSPLGSILLRPTNVEDEDGSVEVSLEACCGMTVESLLC